MSKTCESLTGGRQHLTHQVAAGYEPGSDNSAWGDAQASRASVVVFRYEAGHGLEGKAEAQGGLQHRPYEHVLCSLER